MRILSKEPMLATSAEKMIICPHCAFVIAYLEKDTKVFDMTGDRDYVTQIKCGQCKEKIYVK